MQLECGHGKVSWEQCPLAPVGLPVVCDIDTQLAWCIGCLQPLGKHILGYSSVLEEGELLLPDPELPDSEAPELDQIEGLSC